MTFAEGLMKDHPTACIVLIGNELLSGRTQDKNLNHIAKNLLSTGIKVQECRIIPDVEDVIISTVNTCREQYDYVFTTGGIGPTHDDITAACIAKAFGVTLYRNQEAVEKLKNRVRGQLNDAIFKMADVPKGSVLIQNPVTAAPGFIMDNVYVMAGIPAVMQTMLETILPTLTNGKTLYSKSVTCDLPESHVAPGLQQIQETYPDVEIGSYPRWLFTSCRLNLVARGTEESRVGKVLQEIEALVHALDGTLVQEEDVEI